MYFVKCVDLGPMIEENGEIPKYLTLHKVYEVIEWVCRECYVRIVDDSGQVRMYPSERFKDVNEAVINTQSLLVDSITNLASYHVE